MPELVQKYEPNHLELSCVNKSCPASIFILNHGLMAGEFILSVKVWGLKEKKWKMIVGMANEAT